MYKNISYGNKKLEDLIRKKHLIPYALTARDRYEKGKYYYSEFQGLSFRILFVKYYENGELEGAEIKYENGMQAYMCTDIDPGYDYRLEKDFDGLWQKDDIVNDNNMYTGAEIKYWFFMKGITCFNKKYKEFWPMIDTYSLYQISDKNSYILTANNTHSGRYYNCKITQVEKVTSGE